MKKETKTFNCEKRVQHNKEENLYTYYRWYIHFNEKMYSSPKHFVSHELIFNSTA
jgi:hypothetical protein